MQNHHQPKKREHHDTNTLTGLRTVLAYAAQRGIELTKDEQTVVDSKPVHGARMSHVRAFGKEVGFHFGI